MPASIFISHATTDDQSVQKLREVLELHGQLPYVDSRALSAGDSLSQEIESAIAEARYFVVMVSLKALASDWVKREVKFALQQTRQQAELKVIAVVLPGTDKALVDLLLPNEPVIVDVDEGANDFVDAIPAIFSAIGEQLPEDWKGSEVVTVEPIEELVVKLTDPYIVDKDGVRRVAATAELSYFPADNSTPITSLRYDFVAPFGVVELAEIRWYLESYFRWPTGVFKTRAEQLEQSLPQWGKALFQAIQAGESALAVLTAWRQNSANLRFSVQVDFEPPQNSDEKEAMLYRKAASDLLALPWEIMHDKYGFLSQGGNPIQVRRRLPKHQQTLAYSAKLPIRVLLLSPRPEIDKNNQRVGYLDHRSSAMPLVQAMEHLGRDLVKVDILHPPTFAALKVTLKKAKADGDPYEIVHFDGHGVYDRQLGLGALCFEDPRDKDNLAQRLMQQIDAEKLAEALRDYGVPLV